MLMSDKDIQEAVNSKDLIIRNFSKKSLQPASYDMRVGEEAFSSHEKKPIDIKSTGSLIVKPGDFILVRTRESVKLSPKIAGKIGLRSFHARKGLALLAGPQIDPGFEGALVVGLHNLDANELKLSYKEPFCTIEFYRLSEPVQRPYKGRYQHQSKIAERDCTAIEERIPAWAPIDDRLKRLEQEVKRLTEKLLQPEEITEIREAKVFFQANREKLLAEYEGKYIAILGGKVMDTDEDFSVLAERVYSRYGYKDIYMPKVERKETILHIPTPQIKRK